MRAEAIKESNHLCLYRAHGRNLKLRTGGLSSLTSWFSFSVRYEIQRRAQGLEDIYTQVFLSEEREGRNPMYKKTKIQMQQLCNSDPKRPLKFLIVSGEKAVSFGITTVEQLKVNPYIDLQMIKDGTPAGQIFIENLVIQENPNFADYLNAGWQLSLSVAIDFTASNLQIFDPRSLHFTYSKDPTPYC